MQFSSATEQHVFIFEGTEPEPNVSAQVTVRSTSPLPMQCHDLLPCLLSKDVCCTVTNIVNKILQLTVGPAL